MTKYEYYESASPSRVNRRCINGRITGSGKCVGYCTYDGHPGFLTKELRKEHNCIGKGCFYYIAKERTEKEVTVTIVDHSLFILEEARKELEHIESVYLTKVFMNSFDKYTVCYISISREDIPANISSELSEKTGVNVTFKRLNYDFDTCVELIMTQ